MAANNDVTLPKDFSPERISFSVPKQLTSGGKNIYISYLDKPLLVQTPFMSAPFGISMWPSDNGGPDKYDINVSFEGKDGREPVSQFYDMLSNIDRHTVQKAMDNSQAWFKKRFPSLEVVQELYTPTLKLYKDKVTGEVSDQYPAKFKMTLPFRDGKFQFKAFNERKEDINLQDIVNSEGRGKGAQVRAIIACSAVWVVGNKFGLSWKVRLLEVREKARGNGISFQRTEEDDAFEALDDASDGDVAPARGAPRAGAKKTTVAGGKAYSGDPLSSDDDDDAGAASRAQQNDPLEQGAGSADNAFF